MIYSEKKQKDFKELNKRKDLIKEIQRLRQEIESKLKLLSAKEFSFLNKYLWIEREALDYHESSKNGNTTWVDVIEVYSGIWNFYSRRIYFKWDTIRREGIDNQRLTSDNLERERIDFKETNYLNLLDNESLSSLKSILIKLKMELK